MLAADQLSKWAIRRAAADLPLTIVGRVRLEYNRNTGISFSRLSQGGALVLALVAAVAAAVGIALLLAPQRYRPALGLVFGGAVGNLVDRIRWGSVVDFIAVYGWPSFNVADIAIVAGTALLVLEVLRDARA